MKQSLKMGGGGGLSPVSVEEPYYPEFHYSGEQELELPDEGIMEIRFKKVEESERTDREGKKRYSCSICVREILEVEGEEEVEPPAKTNDSKATESALDELLSKVNKLVETDKAVHAKLDEGDPEAED